MTATSVEKVNGTPVASHAEHRYDPVALAEAEAIRKRAEAEAQALRIEAEGKAKAAEIAAQAEAEQIRLDNEKQRIANERTALRFRREQAVEEAKIAEANTKKNAAERADEAARKEAQAEEQAAEDEREKQEKSADSWRLSAKGFYAVCQVVALPVQIHAFWNPHAPWLAAAPLVLEGGAFVVQRGARAAVDERRPYWHYRLIAWFLAFLAAGINLGHGLEAFDLWTALATAFCSVAGPGVDDLYEHGRIRKRDGKQTRKERKAAEKEAKRLASEKAAEEARRKKEKEAADKAAAETAKSLAETRAKEFPKVWEHALKLAADLGETRVTEAIWKRAKLDVDGALPGESAEVFRMRNAAEARVEAARQKKPVNTVSKTMNAQRANQMPRGQRGPARKPPARRRGDTAPYVNAARKQAAIAAKDASQKEA
ncbi:hypothetical protein [Streptomyces antimycoticus]|uniref:hypothetical protein n=1 Tax=Streptomyces antimycoticus TaxID=68175 RepID=UPI00386A8A92|nr:hypothetical protein OG751_04145 [Streptomyces antimycoticus]